VKLFHPDDAALDVLADVLAGDKNSRLYKRLVFDMQVAQDVNAFQFSGKLDGYFQISVTPKPGQTPSRMMTLVTEEIGKIARDGVTPRELARSLNSRRASFLDNLASVLGKSNQLASYDYNAGTPDYVQQDLARYEKITAADVQRAAVEYLNKPKVVLTVVPEGRRQLMATGGGK
jgi:zinc protease